MQRMQYRNKHSVILKKLINKYPLYESHQHFLHKNEYKHQLNINYFNIIIELKLNNNNKVKYTILTRTILKLRNISH